MQLLVNLKSGVRIMVSMYKRQIIRRRQESLVSFRVRQMWNAKGCIMGSVVMVSLMFWLAIGFVVGLFF